MAHGEPIIVSVAQTDPMKAWRALAKADQVGQGAWIYVLGYAEFLIQSSGLVQGLLGVRVAADPRTVPKRPLPSDPSIKQLRDDRAVMLTGPCAWLGIFVDEIAQADPVECIVLGLRGF